MSQGFLSFAFFQNLIIIIMSRFFKQVNENKDRREGVLWERVKFR